MNGRGGAREIENKAERAISPGVKHYLMSGGMFYSMLRGETQAAFLIYIRSMESCFAYDVL